MENRVTFTDAAERKLASRGRHFGAIRRLIRITNYILLISIGDLIVRDALWAMIYLLDLNEKEDEPNYESKLHQRSNRDGATNG